MYVCIKREKRKHRFLANNIYKTRFIYLCTKLKIRNHTDMITILEETTKYPLQLIGKMVGVCHNSPVDSVDKNIERAKTCIKSGHGRVLEFPNVAMIIDGYSARVIREWYTHIGCLPTRLQTSTRYVNCENFDFITPNCLTTEQKNVYKSTMNMIKDGYKKLINLNMSREDAANILPLGMTTKIVDKRNLRNLIDMSRQRMCGKAYWEYRNLFKEIIDNLKDISNEWAWIINNCFHPKCKELGYCPEINSCKNIVKAKKIELNDEEIFERAKKADRSIINLSKELLSIKDKYGNTPIHYLAEKGVKEVLKLPKELLMIKNNDGNTPIHYLAVRGIKEVLTLDKELLMIPNMFGSTPIHWLAKRGVKEILTLDKELLMIHNMFGSTPIHWLARRGVKEVLTLDKELLSIKDEDGCTPIHCLAKKGIDIPEELKDLI